MTKRKKILKISIISVCAALGVFLLTFAGYSVIFAHKNYANQFIGGTNFGGKNKDQTKEILQNKTKIFLDQEIQLTYKSKTEELKAYNIKPSDLGLQYNIDSTAESLWHYGRGDNIFTNFWQQLKSIFQKNQQSADYAINQESFNKKITEIALEVDNPEKDFTIVYQGGEFILTTDRKEGERIDQEKIKQAIGHQLSVIKHKEITFQTEIFKPQIDETKARKRLAEANGILKAGELSLEVDTQKFAADIDTIGGFVLAKTKGDDIEITSNNERIKLFVTNLATNINVEPQNAQLTVVGGKATVFTTARMGKTLDQVQTVVDVENALAARMSDSATEDTKKKIALKVEVKRPEITDDAINNLGIVELVGTGTTDFKGSPANRVTNINVGMKVISGSLIKPGDQFSTIGKLGVIDASTGYLPELVIKNNQTLPEYGGGLCQVSTTLFRAALNAGLKITERSNHSYRVSYYEPPIGMDATIYDPAPDFKFVNNYGSHLLIQGFIKGTKITFEIYGTKDARTISMSTPEAYNYVSPPPTEEIFSATLPVGERQQIQKSHQGASAKFHYRVERNGEILQDKDFISKYVALPEKWLVGAPAPVPAPTCTDGVQNGDETGIDTGGSCPPPAAEPTVIPDPVPTPVTP